VGLKSNQNSAARLPRIGVGSGGLGGTDTPDYSFDKVALSALQLSFSLGMTFVDTAALYGGGHSEELVGQAIAGKRDEIFVATKVAPENLAPDDLRQSLDGSLQRLRTDYVDLYQVHWSNPAVPLEETMGALEALVDEGKIRHIGVCNFSMAELKEAQAALRRTRLFSLQSEYNLFDRFAETALIPYCRDNGMVFLAYSPLDQGSICGDRQRRARLAEMAAKYECSEATLALAWLTAGDQVTAIPKAGKSHHVRENALAASIDITSDDYAEIDVLCQAAPVEIPVDDIRVVPPDNGGRKVYSTLEEALQNEHGFVPSPATLAAQISGGEFLKPVRVRKSEGISRKTDAPYELLEGRIRYWAWVIAGEGEKPIPCLIRGGN